MNSTGNTMRNIRQLLLVAVCGLVLAIPPVMAETASQASGNPHGLVWESWQPLAGGYMARRRVPARLELPIEERRPDATQSRAKPDGLDPDLGVTCRCGSTPACRACTA